MTGTAAQITNGPNNWHGINWKASTYGASGTSFYRSAVGVWQLELSPNDAGVYAVYNTTYSLSNGGSSNVDIVSKENGSHTGRGLVLNLQADTASKSFYYVGVSRNATSNLAELSVYKALNLASTSVNYTLTTGWTSVLADKVSTGVAWANTGTTWTNIGTLSAQRLGNNIIVSFGSYNGTFTDGGTAITGGYAGVTMAQWDTFGFDNFAMSSVPERTTWALLAGSLTALMVIRRRRVS